MILIVIPCGRGVVYAHRVSAWCMRRLKGYPDGSVSTAWDYASLLCNLYRDTGPKGCKHSQNSLAQSSFNPFYTWYNVLLTGFHHSLVVGIPLLILWNASILPLHLPPLLSFLTCTRVRVNHHHQQFILIVVLVIIIVILFNKYSREKFQTVQYSIWFIKLINKEVHIFHFQWYRKCIFISLEIVRYWIKISVVFLLVKIVSFSNSRVEKRNQLVSFQWSQSL